MLIGIRLCIWVNLSLPFLPSTHIKTASFTSQCVGFVQSSRSRTGLLLGPFKVNLVNHHLSSLLWNDLEQKIFNFEWTTLHTINSFGRVCQDRSWTTWHTLAHYAKGINNFVTWIEETSYFIKSLVIQGVLYIFSY